MDHGIKRAAACLLGSGMVLLAAASGMARTIGPDAWGYVGTDETAFSWDEIAPEKGGTGTEIVPLTGTDDGYSAIPIGFSFKFYGVRHTSVFVSVNGLLAFDETGLEDCFVTAEIPTSSPPNNLVAVFWDDLNLWPAQKIYYAVLGTAPYRRLVVQYYGAPHFDDPNARYHFQVILYETWNRIRMQYLDMQNGLNKFLGDGREATLGIEDPGGNDGLQWSRNQIRSVTNGLCVVFQSPVSADVRLSKQAVPSPALLHSELTYVLTVSNAGPDAATEVLVEDPLPDGLIFTGVETTQGNAAFEDGTVSCSLGALVEHSTATVSIRARVETAEAITNVASVYALQDDPDLSNNTRTQVVTVITAASLSVEGNPAPIGAPSPFAYGSHLVEVNLPLTNRVDSPVGIGPGSRYVCAGWSGPALSATGGAGTEAVFMVSRSATQTWQWTIQHYLSITSLNGSVTGAAEGWKQAGFIYDLVPEADTTYAFSHWLTNGVLAGSNVPLHVAMNAAQDVQAVFVSGFRNVTPQITAEIIAWRYNSPTRSYFGTLRLCNRADSGVLLGRPIWYEVVPTVNRYLRRPTGTNTLDGVPYVDITTNVEAALPATGNGDLILDPGECVIAGEVDFVFRLSSPTTNFTSFVWASVVDDFGFDPPLADTDEDGFTNAEEAAADTDPNDPDSYLHISGLERSAGRLRVIWSGGTTVTQVLMRTTALEGDTAWDAVATNTPPTPQPGAADIEPDEPFRMFRVVVP